MESLGHCAVKRKDAQSVSPTVLTRQSAVWAGVGRTETRAGRSAGP